MTDDGTAAPRPFDRLRILAIQDVEVAPGIRHVEVYTLDGLLTLLWHGPPSPPAGVALFCGGAMGGLLGPAQGLFHDLGVALAAQGMGAVRVSYRRPNDLPSCVLDVLAAADLAQRTGSKRFVTVGHSFGGAVAISAGAALGDATRGVVTLATQSAGCETAISLRDVPLLLIHGEHDEILPVAASEAVRQLAGSRAELVVLPGTGHLLLGLGVEQDLRSRLLEWIPRQLAGH